jgi:hypothetical protein
MTYYSALALKRLRRPAEARRLARALLAYARKLAHTEARIDYFATSLPAMLLFHDDLSKRNAITALFLEAQAALALGMRRRGQGLLNRVLQLDPSHANAADLIAELRTEAGLTERSGARA